MRYKVGDSFKNIKYKTPYTRKSGDANTSVGNTFINMTVHYSMIR